MSLPVFPTLIGRGWTITRSPQWNTMIQSADSGKEVRYGKSSYPWYKWGLSYDFLRSDTAHAEFQALFGFFNQMQGALNPFRYRDEDDNAVIGQGIGLGDGTTTVFQLVRTFGGWTEPVFAPDTTKPFNLYASGNLIPPNLYTVDPDTGLVTVTGGAPGAGYNITADFQFFWNCRFADDTYDFEKFMLNLWQLQQIEFKSLK